MAVEFRDYSFQVKAKLNDITVKWLHETAENVASDAKRNCTRDQEYSNQLAGSYRGEVNAGAGEAKVGTPMQEGYWEEYGTGEHAAHGDGRKGWWIYIPGQKRMGGGQTYRSREEAEQMAAYIRAKYNKDAVVTNGRDPNYTLEKAFKKERPKAIKDLEADLARGMGK